METIDNADLTYDVRMDFAIAKNAMLLCTIAGEPNCFLMRASQNCHDITDLKR